MDTTTSAYYYGEPYHWYQNLWVVIHITEFIMNSFSELPFIAPIQKNLRELGYNTPTPIQSKAIPHILEGRDILGCAQTGTGKTAAFLLPVIQRLVTTPKQGKALRVLVLTPTRELAGQIGENFIKYCKNINIRSTVIYGGVKPAKQINILRQGVEVLIATPGRLLDLQGQGYIQLDKVEFFVLDEADRMLDMGFLPDIKRVLKSLPKRRQNLLFSATMPKNIQKLASEFLNDPILVEVSPQSSTVDNITQKVMFVEKPNKKRLLKFLLETLKIPSCIVFTRTKHGANRLVTYLQKNGQKAAAIHGNKSQNARLRALGEFKSGQINILVATDIASRGLDITGVSHVFNYDLPNIAESYVHRIGRTGRAGATGVAISFCEESEVPYLGDIEKLIDMQIKDEIEHTWHSHTNFQAAIVVRTTGIQQKRKPAQKSKKPHFRKGRNHRSRRKP